MNISTNPIKTPFSGKIPLSNYKGPILKLTEEDLNKINKLQEQINQFEFEIYHINQYINRPQLSYQQIVNYTSTIEKLQYRVNELKNAIKEIKINRHNIQLADKSKQI